MGALADGDGRSFGARYGYSVGKLVEAGDWAGVEAWLAGRRSRAVRVLVWMGGSFLALSVLFGAAMLTFGGPWDAEGVLRVLTWVIYGAMYGHLVLSQGMELRDVERTRSEIETYRRSAEASSLH